MHPDVTRAAWHALEPLNAVAYFAPECAEAPERLGLRGFWMGYFACRAAPMGAVAPGVVDATFFNFHPAHVRRAIPDAWTRATPAAVVAVRSTAAAAALRRVLADGDADRLAHATLPALRRAVDAAAAGAPGRPLFAANLDVAPPDDPVASLWQAATTLREHRGDAHVSLLTGSGLDGCEVNVLFAATDGLPPALFQQSRGWSPDDWAAADRLAERGLVATDGTATGAGRALRSTVERRTDELALAPLAALGDAGVGELLAVLVPAAARVAGAGEIRFPNPMGLPAPPAVGP